MRTRGPPISGRTCLADPDRVSRLLLAGCAVACVSGLALSLVLQHVGGMQPCAWCVLQRGIYLLIAVVCAAGATFVRGPLGCGVSAALSATLAATGVCAALFHQFVAALPGGCGVTIADRFLMITRLYEHVPWLFDAPATCDLANAPLLGIPFALWSATLFTMLGVASMIALARIMRLRAR